jgi:alkanesulfonate monooxygenase SsuD/methylene tetrahydromethanopterin reductase-like flavin-dependent oxidoreductase (luciferase family)
MGVRPQAVPAPVEFKSKFRPPMSGLPLLPPVYQKPHPPIWVACLMSPESFEWTAEQGHNLLYVAYHVDHPVAVERIGWYRDALKKHGRRIEDHEVCCVYHAHFLDTDDDARLQGMVHTPMSEYAAAGIEAARKPPDPTAYKAYERREAGQRDFGFSSYYPGRVVMGGPKQAVERIKALRDAGITQIGLLVDFGSLPQAEIMRSLRVFADKVLPQVRDL